MTTLEKALLGCTWSVHSISPFSKPLTELQLQQLLSCSSLQVARNNNNDDDDDDESNYVGISWMDENNASTQDECSITTTTTTTASSSSSNSKCYRHRHHLRLQIYVQEAWSAELILCYAEQGKDVDDDNNNNNNNNNNNTTFSFALVLARGQKSSYEPVLNWFTDQTGCVIKPCQFSSAELAQATAVWTRQACNNKSISSNSNNRSSSNNSDHNSNPPKPLQLTFQVPPNLCNEHLSTLSLTVPPASMTIFCERLEERRPHHTATTTTNNNNNKRRRKENTTTITMSENQESTKNNNSHNNNNGDNDDDSSSSSSSSESLPILQGLRCFIQEAFCMNIQSFPLTKACCAMATLSNDGRVKFHEERFVSNVLQELKRTVVVFQRMITSQSLSLDNDNDDDDENESS